jgi:RNA polymerase sigma factor (sigma-70 family)
MNNFLPEDRQLLSECFSGDGKASETLIRRYSDLVYRFIQRTYIAKHISFNSQDLEDLHNTVFLKLFENNCKKLRQYQGNNGCSLASWIRIITVRIVLSHLRKKGLDAVAWQKKRMSFEDLPELAEDEATPIKKMEQAEQEHLLRGGIRKLPPRDRLFMKLYFEQGLSVSEVAEAMHLSAANAYTIKHRAVKKLRTGVKSLTN